MCLSAQAPLAQTQDQRATDTLSIREIKTSIKPIHIPFITLERKPLPLEVKPEHKLLQLPCQFTGEVLHQNGPSTFNTIWISGAGKNNKAITLKTLTNDKGKFQASLSPGKYKIEVYGPKGVVATATYELACSKTKIPVIKYEK